MPFAAPRRYIYSMHVECVAVWVLEVGDLLPEPARSSATFQQVYTSTP